MNVNLVWRSDVHLADTPPQSRLDDWAATLLGKLTQVGEIARSTGAHAVLDGGDLFHIKSPSRTSHEMVQRVAEVHHKYPCPTLGNVGNHDVKYGDLRFLSEAALGVLFSSGVIRPCYGGLEFYLGPVLTGSNRVKLYPYDRNPGSGGWLDGNPFSLDKRQIPIVRVVGIPYHGTSYDMNRFTTLTKGDEDYLVVMAHCLASEKGGTMFEAEDIIRYSDLANLDPDVWCFGHWHKDQGIREIAPGKWVVNVGSLSRGSISQDDVNRTPTCATLSFTMQKVTLEKVPLVVTPANEIFDLVGAVRQSARQMSVDTLVESLKGLSGVRQEGSLLEDVRNLPEVLPPVKERAIAYLEKAGAR